jgi:hypothetical protein
MTQRYGVRPNRWIAFTFVRALVAGGDVDGARRAVAELELNGLE